MDKKLTLFEAIPLGIGSIIGSGILFLPSLTYKLSESDVLISWLVIIVLCLVGTIYLKRLLFNSSLTERNISGMVKAGLGESAGNSVYVILLGTVVIGMPSAAIIAGDYIQQVFPTFLYCKELVAYTVVTVALVSNFKGISNSSKLASLISIGLIIVSLVFVYFTTGEGDLSKLRPTMNPYKIYQGSVLAFWAFAGFENLTFLYDKFQNPKRDFLPTVMISIVTCGILYLFLVINYSSIIGHENIKSTIGLLQISEILDLPFLKYGIAFFALLAVLINLVSWTSGVSQLIINISKREIFPFVKKEVSQSKAVIVLGIMFYCSLTIGLFFGDIFEKLLSIVSTNFLVIYALTFVSYLIVEKKLLAKSIPMISLFALMIILSSSGYYLIYPLSLFFITFYFQLKKI